MVASLGMEGVLSGQDRRSGRVSWGPLSFVSRPAWLDHTVPFYPGASGFPGCISAQRPVPTPHPPVQSQLGFKHCPPGWLGRGRGAKEREVGGGGGGEGHPGLAKLEGKITSQFSNGKIRKCCKCTKRPSRTDFLWEP